MIPPRPSGADHISITYAARHRSLKEGLNPLAYPVDYKTNAEEMPWTLVYKQGQTLMGTALHEWVGLVAYYITGRTTQLLPAP